MDITPYLQPRTAPHAVLDAPAERRARPRFMLPTADGDWRAVTWGAFALQIRRLGAWLAGVGLEPGDRAAIYAPNRVEWLSAALAVQAVGGVLVPVYPASTAAQLAYVLDHSDARVLFVDTAALLERALEAAASCPRLERVVLLDDALPQPEAAPRLSRLGDALAAGTDLALVDRRLAEVRLDRPGLMLYTSGTTGNPKGVPLTHENVAQNGADWLRVCGPAIREGAVDLLWLPMSHIFGLGEACLGNLLGFTSYLVPPERVLAELPVVRPDVFMSVPAVWEKIARLASDAQPGDEQRRVAELTGGRLTFSLSGGAGLKREVKELFFRAGLTILEGYGLTECSPTLTLNRLDDFRFDSVGKPLPSVELRLDDDGEILARGPNVFAGYHKDPEATAAAFTPDGWLKTGDVGRFTDDGFLQIVDRKKEILVTAGGKNVPPANIEQRFADDPIFTHVVVYGDGKSYLTAGVWLDAEAVDARVGRAADRRQAIDALVAERIDVVNETLARFEQIRRWRIMDTPLTVARGLLTSTLKMRRRQIYETFRADFEALYE
jgi:long-chain acyl-CoA synthetase